MEISLRLRKSGGRDRRACASRHGAAAPRIEKKPRPRPGLLGKPEREHPRALVPVGAILSSIAHTRKVQHAARAGKSFPWGNVFVARKVIKVSNENLVPA
jgi:hypothetical protein